MNDLATHSGHSVRVTEAGEWCDDCQELICRRHAGDNR